MRALPRVVSFLCRQLPACRAVVAAILCTACALSRAAEPERLAVLMLGDKGHHRPAVLADLLSKYCSARKIDVTYTDEVAALDRENLARYACLLIYRDSGTLPPDAEAALLQFVEGGRGLVAVHCASHCFRNSDRYTALVGGRFLKHGAGEFRARVLDAQHAAMRGVSSFTSRDETYLHNELADDIYVLMARPRSAEEGGGLEPWTWVRRQGKGRVFYTASGHDEATWNAAGFMRLVESGIRWAAGTVPDDLPPLEYVPARIPRYDARRTSEDRETMQAPLSPQDSQRHMRLPEGFRVELFAAEPQVVKPMAMAFDERGRLWVVESVDYPNDLVADPHQNGNDRVKICEDTDGDGRADRFTVFADRLNVPTGIVPVRGGAIVAVAPHLLLLTDDDGDGRADARKILYTGFGRGDTHAVLSNLRYGLDNWMYGSVGYSGGTVAVGSSKATFRMGLFRFRPDGSAFEFLTTTSNNTWGLGQSEGGDIFASTANNQHAVHLAIPNRHFEAVRGWHGQGSGGIEDHKRFHPATEDVRQVDFFGGYTAAAGFELYTARDFPEWCWNRAAFVCEPTGHLVHVDLLERRGSGFVARDGYNLLASSDAWTAPVAAQVGPDGAVWVLDWYNYIVQHNPTPKGFQNGPGNAYVTPLRDKRHGRVWRVVHAGDQGNAGKDEPPRRNTTPDLSKASTGALLDALGHDNLFWRLTAQRLLVERASRDEIGRVRAVAAGKEGPVAAVHALRTLAEWQAWGQGKPPGDDDQRVLSAALSHAAADVRRSGLAVLPRTDEGARLLLAARDATLADRDALVVRDALLALSEMPGSDAGGAALAELVSAELDLNDRWLLPAAIAAAAPSDAPFLARMAAMSPRAEVRAPVAELVRAIAEHYARGAPADSLADTLEALARGDAAVAAHAATGMAAGWPENKPAPPSDRLAAALALLVERVPADRQLEVVTLARRVGAEDGLKGLKSRLEERLLAGALDEKQEDGKRLAAAGQLAASGASADAARRLVEAVGPRASAELIEGLLAAAATSSDEELGGLLVARFRSLTPAGRAGALAVVLSRPAWTNDLLSAAEAGTVSLEGLSLDQQQHLVLHPDKAIAERAARLLARGGRLPDPDRARVLAEAAPAAERRGDPAGGKTVFKNQCAKCHAHGGEGGRVGPDLTGMAAHPKAELLVHILDPNRSVEGNYKQHTVLLDDGRVLSGILAGETKTALDLIDAEGKPHVVLRENIERLVSTEKSLMPEGFEKLPGKDLVDLLEFLTARGKYLPLPLHQAATVVSTRGMFFGEESAIERLIFDDWSPKTFEGVPFHLVDPVGDRVRNVILLHGPRGTIPPKMPREVSLPCNARARAIHLLSGVSGWGYPAIASESISLIVRLRYEDGRTEDHPLVNGRHFADYIRRVDVPDSKLAYMLRGQQIRYLAILPRREETIKSVEFVKGDDATAPIVMAVTVELLDSGR